MKTQEKRLKEFEEEFESRFLYVADAVFVKAGTGFSAYTNGGIKQEGERFPAFENTPEAAVDSYINYINSLDIEDKNILIWRDRPSLYCFDDEELGRVCTVYSRLALLKGQ